MMIVSEARKSADAERLSQYAMAEKALLGTETPADAPRVKNQRGNFHQLL
jgi:hypothetical protein